MLWPDSSPTLDSDLLEPGQVSSMSTVPQVSRAVSSTHPAVGSNEPPAGPAAAPPTHAAAPQRRRASGCRTRIDSRILNAIRAIAYERRPRGSGMETPEAARKRGDEDIALCSLIADTGLSSDRLASLRLSCLTRRPDGSALYSIENASGNIPVTYAISQSTMRHLDAMATTTDSDGRIFSCHPRHLRTRLRRALDSVGIMSNRGNAGRMRQHLAGKV